MDETIKTRKWQTKKGKYDCSIGGVSTAQYNEVNHF